MPVVNISHNSMQHLSNPYLNGFGSSKKDMFDYTKEEESEHFASLDDSLNSL